MTAFLKRFGLLVLESSILPASISLASAAPAYFPGTGQWYEAVYEPNGLTWDEAYTEAINRGGYLCTISNADENVFVASLVDSTYYSDVSINGDRLGPWLGGFRHAFESNWQWVTGEPFGYANWWPGQPDGYGGSEQRLQFYAGASTGATWGDCPSDPPPGYSAPRGFIVEYNYPKLSITQSNAALIISWPAPATGWILETTSNLDSNAWSQVSTNEYQTNLASVFITTTNQGGNAFYRLRQN